MTRILMVFLLVAANAAAQIPQRYAVGIVNGDSIRLDVFSQDVGRRIELSSLAGRSNESAAVESTWNEMVRQVLIRQQAARMGIVITATDVDEKLQNDPPPFVRQGFADEQGRFLPDVLRAVLRRPDSLLKARYPNASPADLKQHTADLRATVNELREQIKMMMVEQRLRDAVLATIPIDTAAVRRTYAELTSNCVADVVSLPCAPSTTEPTEEIMRSWYLREIDRYAAARPMRRLAMLTWSLTPTKQDSADFVVISRRMQEMWKSSNKRIRQDMAAAFAKQPDVHSVSIDAADPLLGVVFAAAKGHVAGDMIGPVMQADTTYYMLIDKPATKDRPTLTGRLMRMAMEMAPERKDSTMKAIQDAIKMYEEGAEFGDVAAKFGRTITVSPWVTIDDSVAGSYKLVDLAFMAQVGTALDPVMTPHRTAVLSVVADSTPAGTMPFDKVSDRVRDDVMRDRACLDRALAARSMRTLCSRLDDGMLIIAEQLPGMSSQREVTIDRAGTIGTSVLDARLADAVYAAPGPGLIGPVLGDRGWYVVNVLSITHADPTGFASWLKTETGRDMLEIHREKAWQDHMYDLRMGSTIVDERWKFFNY